MKKQPNQTEIKLTLWERLKLETPKFWKKIGVIGGSLVTIGIALLGLEEKYHFGILPAYVYGYLITGGTVMGLLPAFAVKTPPDANVQKPTADGDDL